MKTKNEYEEHLNEVGETFDYESDEWIIGGKRRDFYANLNLYGTAVRKYDPIAFEVGFNEFKLN